MQLLNKEKCMSKRRIQMIDLRIILQMHLVDGVSMRKIADRTGVPYSTIHNYIALAKSKEITWTQVASMSDESLECVLFANDQQRPMPNSAYIEQELKRPGVTLQLLWQEYKEAHPDGYQYSRYCEIYEVWRKKNDVYTPIPHKAGEELFVDYSGDKMTYICPLSSTPLEAEIFVAVLGASGRIYAEASKSQKLCCWVESNINAFEYNGGVTELVIPDNLKSAVTCPDRYEPSINRTYADMANHYGTFIVPARVVKPKDKAIVEQSVQCVQREILAILRDQTFFGLDALNQAIRKHLLLLNNRPFKKRLGSRESCFLQMEKSTLKPLPETRYCYREWITKLIVGQDHHVLIHSHSYSIPFQYARMEVEVALDIKMVEIFYKGQVIARHLRSYVEGERTTLHDHMPPKYQHLFESYDKEKLLEKAKKIGEETFTWVEVVFSLKGRPPKTLCHTVQGALILAKEFGADKLEAICKRALLLNIHSYKALRSMLIKKADQLPLPVPGSTQSHLPQLHANVRGAAHFN
jgi:transposase